MTVKELIRKLEDEDGGTEIFVRRNDDPFPGRPLYEPRLFAQMITKDNKVIHRKEPLFLDSEIEVMKNSKFALILD